MLSVSSISFKGNPNLKSSSSNNQGNVVKLHSQPYKDTVSFGISAGYSKTFYAPLGDEFGKLRSSVRDIFSTMIKKEIKKPRDFCDARVQLENINKDGSHILLEGVPNGPLIHVTKDSNTVTYRIPDEINSKCTYSVSKRQKGMPEGHVQTEEEARILIDAIQETLESPNAKAKVILVR